jgi:hypothetical protein
MSNMEEGTCDKGRAGIGVELVISFGFISRPIIFGLGLK